MVSLGHQELVGGVQRAVAQQLQRDGRLQAGMELGLVFCLHTPQDMSVSCTVRRYGQILFELNGGRSQLCAVATQLALDKLEPEERSGLEPQAQVRWRALRFTGEHEHMDQFVAEVEFRERFSPTSEKGVLH